MNSGYEIIRAALGALTSDVTPVGDGAWRMTLLKGAPHVVSAKTNGDWLCLEMDSLGAAQRADHFWDVLPENASLPGLAKWALTATGEMSLRAELPLFDKAKLAARVRETCAAVAGCAEGETSIAETDSPMDLKALCAESGWPFSPRGDHKISIEMEVPETGCQAILTPRGRGLQITCELATFENIAAECQQAIGSLLLSASRLVRMARPCIKPNNSIQFEVVFESPPEPSEISIALESLSVACSICGEEVRTLQTPAIAQLYLALRGRGPGVVAGERT